jgi:hypothetical protein
LYSYRNLCETRLYNSDRYTLKTLVPGLLRHGDIADFLPCLAPRPATFIRPRNAYGEPVPESYLK